MLATLRRCEGVHGARSDELTERVIDKVVPRRSELEGFGGHLVIEAGV